MSPNNLFSALLLPIEVSGEKKGGVFYLITPYKWEGIYNGVLGNGWNIYTVSTGELEKYCEELTESKYPSSIITKIQQVPIIPNVSFSMASHIINIHEFGQPELRIGLHSEFETYCSVAKDVGAKSTYVPNFVFGPIVKEQIEVAERFLSSDVLQPWQKICVDEAQAAFVIAGTEFYYKKEGEKKKAYNLVNLNSTVDGWSIYGELTTWRKEKRQTLCSSFNNGKIIQFDYKAFVLSVLLNLIEYPKIEEVFRSNLNLYDYFGKKKEVITVISGDYLISNKAISLPYLWLPHDFIDMLYEHKNNVINSQLINPFEYQIVVDCLPYNRYTYFIRSVMAYIVKIVMYRIVKEFNNRLKDRAKLFGIVWDSFYIDVEDGAKEAAEQIVMEIMETPVTTYGYNWRFAVSEKEIS